MSMKVKTISRWTGALVLVFALATPARGDDNTLRINDDDVRLRARPNEKAPTIMKLNDGQVVKLVERRGRWLLVQVRSKQGWIQRTYVEEDMRDESEVVAAREGVQDTRGRRSKTNMRRGDKGFDTLDEDARGEDGVSERVDDGDEDDEEADEERPKKKSKKKAMKADDDEDEDEAEDEDEDDEEEEAPRKAKTKKVAKAGIHEGATVALKAKTPVRMKPSKKSDALFEASKGEEVEVVMINDDDPEYVRIQTEDGSKGWVPRKALAMVGGGGGDDDAEDEDGESDDEEAEDEENPNAEEGDEDADASVSKSGPGFFSDTTISMLGSVGLLSKGQTFVSAGTDPVRSNYKVGNNAPVIILGATLMKPFGKYEAGVEAGYVRSIGGKGITIKDPSGTMDPEQVAWVTQQIDFRVVGGYKLSGGKYTVGGGLGYHIGQVAVSGNMIAALPGERISGFRFGGEFRAPKLTEKIGMRAALDTLLGASITQQAGITDGTSAKVTAYYLSLGGTYDLKKHWAIQAGYGFAYERMNFSGESERNGPSVTSGRRKDMQHTLGVGVGYEF